MLNLLRNNSSNQTFFREGSYIQRVSIFFELDLDQDEIEVGWSAQKVSNMLHMLQVGFMAVLYYREIIKNSSLGPPNHTSTYT